MSKIVNKADRFKVALIIIVLFIIVLKNINITSNSDNRISLILRNLNAK